MVEIIKKNWKGGVSAGKLNILRRKKNILWNICILNVYLNDKCIILNDPK